MIQKSLVPTLLLLLLLLAGCGSPIADGPGPGNGGSPPNPGTTMGVAENVTLPSPEFFLDDFITIAADDGTRLAAYGQDSLGRAVVGIYSNETRAWSQTRLADAPSHVSEAWAAAASDGTISVLANVNVYPIKTAVWAQLSGEVWQTESPSVWAGRVGTGVASVSGSWFAMVTGLRSELWKLDAGTWRQDIGPAGTFAWLSGDSDVLRVCLIDSRQDIVYAWRGPSDTTFRVETVHSRPPGVIAGGRCILGEGVDGYPVLVWFSPVVALDDRDAKTYGAAKEGSTWNARVLSTNLTDPYPEQVVTIANATFAHVQGDEVFALRDGSWSRCPMVRDAPSLASVVKWAGRAAWVVYSGYDESTITLTPIQGTNCTALNA